MSPSSRTDKSHEVNYPAAADARGSTRVNHQRRPYYLGPFESPQSYVMFGLWKHCLKQTGEAPETKDLRPLVDQLLNEASAAPPKVSKRSVSQGSVLAIFATLCLSVAIVISANIFFRNRVPKVDDRPLSVDEQEFIRGFREHHEHLATLVKRQDVASHLVKLTREEEAEDADYHRKKDREL